MALSGFRTTADKREIKDFLKLPSATSFIPRTLSEIARSPYESVYKAFKHFK